MDTLSSYAALKGPSHLLSVRERCRLSLERARYAAAGYFLTKNDIRTLSTTFWAMHLDPIVWLDASATTLLTTQMNLCLGTLLQYAHVRPDLTAAINSLLRYEVSGQFCMTEVDHDTNEINLQTTATLLADNTFEIHTPHRGAAKLMLPIAPCGIPIVAIVWAKLIVLNRNRGIRPFLVTLTDGRTMCPGITVRILPSRGGSKPLEHSITSFNRVNLPSSALIGTILEKSNKNTDLHDDEAFHTMTWRVAVGSLALASSAIPGLQAVASIAAQYIESHSTTSSSGSIPIISERTILVALAQSFVLKALFKVLTTRLFVDESIDLRVRHGFATVFQVVATQHTQAATFELSERCSAQGLFPYNQIPVLHTDFRGNAILEGELLGKSTRLASDMLLGHYVLPSSTHPTSLLALREMAVFEEIRSAFQATEDDPLNRRIVLKSEALRLVTAIGYRMAYDAAVDAGLSKEVLDVYVCAAVKVDQGRYEEGDDDDRSIQAEDEDKVMAAALPWLDEWLEATDFTQYIWRTVALDPRWNEFVEGVFEVWDSARCEVSSSKMTTGM